MKNKTRITRITDSSFFRSIKLIENLKESNSADVSEHFISNMASDMKEGITRYNEQLEIIKNYFGLPQGGGFSLVDHLIAQLEDLHTKLYKEGPGSDLFLDYKANELNDYFVLSSALKDIHSFYPCIKEIKLYCVGINQEAKTFSIKHEAVLIEIARLLETLPEGQPRKRGRGQPERIMKKQLFKSAFNLTSDFLKEQYKTNFNLTDQIYFAGLCLSIIGQIDSYKKYDSVRNSDLESYRQDLVDSMKHLIK